MIIPIHVPIIKYNVIYYKKKLCLSCENPFINNNFMLYSISNLEIQQKGRAYVCTIPINNFFHSGDIGINICFQQNGFLTGFNCVLFHFSSRSLANYLASVCTNLLGREHLRKHFSMIQ